MQQRQDYLADSLEKSAASLMDRWCEAVRRDPRIKSDDALSPSMLRDHMPAMLEEIGATLRRDDFPGIELTRDARVHVYTRYKQDYRLRDLVCELSLLRLILCEHLSAAAAVAAPPVPLNEYARAVHLLNLYLDEELRYAVSVYSEVANDPPAGN